MAHTPGRPTDRAALREVSRRRRTIAYGVAIVSLLLAVAASFVFILWTIGLPVFVGGPDSGALLRQHHLSYTWFDVASGPGRGLWTVPLLLLVLGIDIALRLMYGRSRRATGFLLLLFFAGGMAAGLTLNLTPGGLHLYDFYAAHHPVAHSGAAVVIALPLLGYDGLTTYCLWRMLIHPQRVPAKRSA